MYISKTTIRSRRRHKTTEKCDSVCIKCSQFSSCYLTSSSAGSSSDPSPSLISSSTPSSSSSSSHSFLSESEERSEEDHGNDIEIDEMDEAISDRCKLGRIYDKRKVSDRCFCLPKWFLLIGFLTILPLPTNAIVEMRCGSIDIRNSPKMYTKSANVLLGDSDSVTDFQNMSQVNCTVVEGSFIMTFISSKKQSDYPRFPYIREITGSLLVFEVQGLKRLSWVLPNLRVIGGQVLIQHYALIVYKNDDLESLGLDHLTVIRNGGVRITDNKRLCHTRTIDWKSMIMSKVNDVVLDDAAESSVTETGKLCPTGDCEADPDMDKKCKYMEWEDLVVQSCWNATTCQKACKYDRIGEDVGPGCDPTGKKCDNECLGGCDTPNDPRACHACRHFHYQGRCVPKCADNLFVLLNRRCVTEEKCLSLNPTVLKAKLHIKAVNGVCSDRCPEGYEEKPDDPSTCVKCVSECQITCVGNFSVDTYAKAMEIKRCHIIDGSLTIEIRGSMDSGMATELGEAFSKIHTITGYLTIYRSPTFLSFFMFKSLKRIQGNFLHLEKYSLSVFENPNLKKLFDPTVHFVIEKGYLQFHNNRMLCFRQIQQLMEKLEREREMSDIDQSSSSNGDKAICDDSTFEVKVDDVSYSYILLSWASFNTSDIDHRKFLGYEVYYKEVERVDYNMSIDDDRSACSDSWHSQFIERKSDHDTKQVQEYSLDDPQFIKPYTTYAFYVSTQIVHHIGARNAVSKIGFATTKFSTPDPPVVTVHRVLDDRIELHWEPPVRPNGVITHYSISWREIDVDIDYMASKFCLNDADVSRVSLLDFSDDEKGSSTTTTMAPTLSSMVSKAPANTCSAISGCCKCPKKIDVEETEEDAKFENELQNIVIVQSCDIDFDPVRCAAWEPELEEIPQEIAEKLKNEKTISARIRRASDAWEHRRREIYKSRHSIRKSYEDEESYSAILILKRSRRAINPFSNDTKDEDDENKERTEKKKIRVMKKNQNSTSNSTYPMKFKNDLDEKRFAVGLWTKNVTAKPGTNVFIIPNLRHYTQYSITVSACQDVTVENSYCSPGSKAAKMKRTKPLPDIDTVQNDTIKVEYLTNSSSIRVTWEPPEVSNGGIQGYKLRLLNVLGGTSEEICQKAIDGNWSSVEDGVIMKVAGDGDYRVEIVAHSLYLKFAVPVYANEIVSIYTPGFWTIRNIIIACCIFILVLLVAGLIAYYTIKMYYGRKVKQMADLMSSNPEYVIEQIYKEDEWELKRESLELLEEIGTGTFGKVFRGIGKDVDSTCGEKFGECAIKTVQDKANGAERLHFLLEANVMKTFKAPFIVKLYGVVSTGQPTLCVMELMSLGNLRDYLRSRRPGAEENKKGLDVPSKEQYHEWACQIADGMAYLESIKFCHRDLAARNCMVRADEVVKIGDFGMARDLYYHDYYKPTGKRLMPVRWMAPESLKDGKFDSKSDCWSYGIVLYEMLTLGQQPYQGLGNDEVLNYIGMSRKILDRPLECPEYWYKVMKMCWRYQPRDRPSFAQLVHMLSPHSSEEFKTVSYVCNNSLHIEDPDTDDEPYQEKKENDYEPDYVAEPIDDRLRLDSIAMKEFRPCSSRSSSNSSIIMSRDSRKSSVKSLLNSNPGSNTKQQHQQQQDPLNRPHSLERASGSGTYKPLSTGSFGTVNENFEEGDYVDRDVRRDRHRKRSVPSISSSTGNIANTTSSNNSNTPVENEDGYCLSNRSGAMDFPSWGEGDRLTSSRNGHR